MFVGVLVAGLSADAALLAKSLPAPAMIGSHFIPPQP
jgi:hypothetical protein